jgi:hypothetical protein
MFSEKKSNDSKIILQSKGIRRINSRGQEDMSEGYIDGLTGLDELKQLHEALFK